MNNTTTYTVFDGTYPFKEIIGAVVVFDSPTSDADALEAAIALYGGHPVVAPDFTLQ